MEGKHQHHPDKHIHGRFYLASYLGEDEGKGEEEVLGGTNGWRKGRGVELPGRNDCGCTCLNDGGVSVGLLTPLAMKTGRKTHPRS